MEGEAARLASALRDGLRRGLLRQKAHPAWPSASCGVLIAPVRGKKLRVHDPLTGQRCEASRQSWRKDRKRPPREEAMTAWGR